MSYRKRSTQNSSNVIDVTEKLRERYTAVLYEPVPERLRVLINRLKAVEARKKSAKP